MSALRFSRMTKHSSRYVVWDGPGSYIGTVRRDDSGFWWAEPRGTSEASGPFSFRRGAAQRLVEAERERRKACQVRPDSEIANASGVAR